MRTTLSTRELAEALGTSESSIKRWVDNGRLRGARTGGGHRRVPLQEAIRFIRETRLPVARPEVLGLREMAASGGAMPAVSDAGAELRARLETGDAAAARGLILSLYMAGEGAAEICDGPIREAMEGIGGLWKHDAKGIYTEHRATEICLQAVHQLQLMFEPSEGAPAAVGGAAPGDPYALPSLCVAAVLAAEGFRARNLGPNMPLDALLSAVEADPPAICWVSVSYAAEGEKLAKDLTRLARRLAERGIALMVGGQGVREMPLAPAAGMFQGNSMKELVSFARGYAMARQNRAQ